MTEVKQESEVCIESKHKPHFKIELIKHEFKSTPVSVLRTRKVELSYDTLRDYVLKQIQQKIHRKMNILPNSYVTKDIQVRVQLPEELFFLIAGPNCYEFKFDTTEQLENYFPSTFLIKMHKNSQTKMQITSISGKVTIKQNACFKISYNCKDVVAIDKKPIIDVQQSCSEI